MNTPQVEQELLDLSRQMWRWMSERNIEALNTLIHDNARFVHMGATFSKSQELDVMRKGEIQMKEVDFQESSVRFVGATAIVLNKIRLVAEVYGNEAINPFVVTEVYAHEGNAWTLASLAFTRLLTA
ncbi:MAG TPA: nuclear transport factor 2 family protein [Hymenobacter sp.]|jgi:hypothetical protein|uniref:nuclear transport factor 2 family protein n=1 Tax=Hymenobacter sp. TaxID=1898978 RepID=UPI002ED88647